jgi:hypothetical protein
MEGMIFMAKTQVLEFNAFMKGELKPKYTTKSNAGILIASTAGALFIAMLPTDVMFLADSGAVAAAATAGFNGTSTFKNIMDTILNIADYAAWGTIVYSGGTWMFGNRTKALEILLGSSIGYVIIRHAEDIRNWLQHI